MKFDPGFARKYPNLVVWIADNLPPVRHKPEVWEPFRRFGQLTILEAESAIRVNRKDPVNGTDPEIDSMIVHRAFGMHRGLKRHEHKVFLARWFCKDFEKKDPDKLFGTYIHKTLEATILHEFVHWGDWKRDHRRQPDIVIDGEKRDVGAQFEQEAYGVVWETINW